MLYNRFLLLNRSNEINNTVRADVAAAESVTLTTNAATVGRNAVSAANVSGVLFNHPISGSGVAANTKAVPDIANSLIQLSNAATGTIASGSTLTLAAPATTIVTTGTTAEGGSALIFANSNNAYVGQKMSGTGVAADSYVKAINGGTLTASVVTSGTVASGTTITLATASTVVLTEDSEFEGNSAVLTADPVNTHGIIPGQRATGGSLPAKTIVSSVDYDTGEINLESTNPITTKISSGGTVTLAVAGTLVANAATTPTGDNKLHFADTDGVAEGMTITTTGSITSGLTVDSFDATTVTLSSAISSTRAVNNSQDVVFSFPGLVSTTGMTSSIDGVVAISATHSFVDLRLSGAAGVNANVGDLRTFANSVAADMESSTGKSFVLESAVTAGNSVMLRFLTDY